MDIIIFILTALLITTLIIFYFLHNNVNYKLKTTSKKLKDSEVIQKAILDGVEEAFFVFDKDGLVKDTFSKSTYNIFGKDIENKFLGDILDFDTSEWDDLKTFCYDIIDEKIPFKDLKALAPQLYKTSDNREIHLNYYPLRSEQNKIEKIVVIAIDKTEDKKRGLELAKNEQMVHMLVKIGENKQDFIKFLLASKDMIHEMNIVLKNYVFNTNESDVLDKIYRGIHTLKGGSSMYYMNEIETLCHMIEDNIEKIQVGQKKFNKMILKKYLNDLESAYLNFFKGKGRLLGITSFEGIISMSDKQKVIEQNKLSRFEKIILEQKNKLIIDQFNETFYFKEIGQYFEPFYPLIQDLAQRLGKKVNPPHVRHNGVLIDTRKYDEVFGYFVHIFRNIIDHGIEKPEIRLAQNKNEYGNIEIDVEEFDHIIMIKIMDDGQGINPEFLRLKLAESKYQDHFNETSSDEEILQCLFLPNFSTKEDATEISGRGVGLDAVKDVLEKKNATIKVYSKHLKYTYFEINLPK